ncbi:MAG: hypothetical protein ABIN97_10595 [Ginsengibacter sp.]
MQKHLLLFLFLPCLSFCQQPAITKSNNYIYPDSTWQFINDSPKEGWSNDSINKLKRFIIDSTKYEYGRQTPTDLYLKVLDKLIAAKKDR